jgi:uncharacterized membrane protein YidH (DUF202 family)
MTGHIEKKASLDVATRLAFDRTRVAYDRTMMAWIRTATSLITLGFTIFKFFQIETGSGGQGHRLIGPREFALSMVGIGLISLLLGSVEHEMMLVGISRNGQARNSLWAASGSNLVTPRCSKSAIRSSTRTGRSATSP